LFRLCRDNEIFGPHIFLPIRSREIAIRSCKIGIRSCRIAIGKRKTSVHEVRKEPICVIPKLGGTLDGFLAADSVTAATNAG
jgi:hypothetical protein